jgi:hypothetical protein
MSGRDSRSIALPVDDAGAVSAPAYVQTCSTQGAAEFSFAAGTTITIVPPLFER